MRKICFFALALFLLFSVSSVFAFGLTLEEGGHAAGEGLGAALPVWSVIPFVGILLSIALFPLLAERFWHHHFDKVSAAWAVAFSVPFLLAYKGEGLHEILHIYITDYIPFIVLLWALFTVAGGIYLKGRLWGSPLSNAIMLFIGTAIASWVGTTGASMLLIRPMLRMNSERKSKVHLVIFFIFLVSNIGGSLTPLGDPPLFLGFLHGVPFFWTFNLIQPMLVVSVSLLLLFFLLDSYFYRKEGLAGKGYGVKDLDFDIKEGLRGELVVEEVVDEPKSDKHTEHVMKKEELGVLGLINVVFLIGILGAVLFSGYVKLGEFSLFGIHVPISFAIRDGVLVLIVYLSMKFTPKEAREGNEFTWFPIKEVAILFAGIFMTIIPVLKMLQAGVDGHLGFIVEAVKQPLHYFWVTGLLSSFLDNAPTYLTFFNTALGSLGLSEAQIAAGLAAKSAAEAAGISSFEPLLLAISCGAVFFGAVTYIGNAPNFMVKSIAQENGIPMPSFFGYMGYSVLILLPLFALTSWIFF